MYKKIEAWMNSVLNQELSDGIAAINFNIYDDIDNYWSIQLVGTGSFVED